MWFAVDRKAKLDRGHRDMTRLFCTKPSWGYGGAWQDPGRPQSLGEAGASTGTLWGLSFHQCSGTMTGKVMPTVKTQVPHSPAPPCPHPQVSRQQGAQALCFKLARAAGEMVLGLMDPDPHASQQCSCLGVSLLCRASRSVVCSQFLLPQTCDGQGLDTPNPRVAGK